MAKPSLTESMLANLKWRWPDRADLAPIGALHGRGLAVAADIAKRRDELAVSRDLTAVGKARALRDWARGTARVELIRLAAAIDAQRELLAAERERLHTPVIDRGDLVTQLARQELRAFLLSLPIGERLEVLLRDPEMAEAALTGHPQLTGLDAEARGRVSEAHAQRQHAARLAEIEDAEAALDLAGVVQGAAAAELRDAANFDADAPFAFWMTTGAEPDERPDQARAMELAYSGYSPADRVAVLRGATPGRGSSATAKPQPSSDTDPAAAA